MSLNPNSALRCMCARATQTNNAHTRVADARHAREQLRRQRREPRKERAQIVEARKAHAHVRVLDAATAEPDVRMRQ